MKYPVLVLNADYQPHRVVDWQDGFTMIYGKGEAAAHMAASYDATLKDSMGRTYNYPAVIVLNTYVKNSNKIAPYSKRAVMLRDGFACQYCGAKPQKKYLTIDHVIPKCRANTLPKGIKLNSFENCITACLKCNSEKADKPLSQCNFKLSKRPIAITRSMKVCLDIQQRYVPNEWIPYIQGLNDV